MKIIIYIKINILKRAAAVNSSRNVIRVTWSRMTLEELHKHISMYGLGRKRCFVHIHRYFPLGSVPVEVGGEHGLVLAAALKSSGMEVSFCAKNLMGYVRILTLYIMFGFFSSPGPNPSENCSRYIYKSIFVHL